MARQPTVRWNESAQRWMAWVRFPDGSRRKVERIDKADAKRDLDRLLALRAEGLDADPRGAKLLTFDQVIDAWFEAGCPNVTPTRRAMPGRSRPRRSASPASCSTRVCGRRSGRSGSIARRRSGSMGQPPARRARRAGRRAHQVRALNAAPSR
jgi:hypothetical protein